MFERDSVEGLAALAFKAISWSRIYVDSNIFHMLLGFYAGKFALMHRKEPCATHVRAWFWMHRPPWGELVRTVSTIVSCS